MKLSMLIAAALAAASGTVGLHGQAANNSTLHNKIIVGYQGWFSAGSDGSGWNKWNKWEIIKGADKIPGVDMWPYVDEYTTTYTRPDWVLRNGNLAKVYSAWDVTTVRKQFEWMKDNTIDGAFVGRATAAIRRGDVSTDFRNQVLKNVKDACGTHGRVFYVNYDISDDENKDPNTAAGAGQNVLDFIYDDFNALVTGSTNFRGKNYRGIITDSNGVLSARYLKHNGKPVVRIFGIGSKKNEYAAGQFLFSAQEAETKLANLRNIATVIIGVNNRWRTADSPEIRTDWKVPTGTPISPEVEDVWQSVDFIQPWSVNAYGNEAGADTYFTRNATGRVKQDIDWGRVNDIGILPVIWPGFSWRNKQDGDSPATPPAPLAYQTVPRGNGSFYWNQGYEVIELLKAFPATPVTGSTGRENVRLITVAMFDEIDEGTAIMKLEVNDQKIPNGNSYSRLNTIDPRSIDPIANATYLSGLADPTSSTNKATFVKAVGPNVDQYLWLTKRIRANLLTTTNNTQTLPTNYPN
jgi:hypothetical protein